MLTRAADMIKTKIDHRERASICGRFGEMSAILHRHLEESPGIELLSVVVDCQELGSTAWSIGLIRATAKARLVTFRVGRLYKSEPDRRQTSPPLRSPMEPRD